MNKSRALSQDQVQARGLLLEAKRLHSIGDTQRAEAILNELLKRNSRDLHTLVALGIIAAETDRNDVAISRLQEALSYDPKCVPALCWLSLLLQQSGRSEEARRCAEKAVGLDPRNPVAHASLGRFYLQRGDHAVSVQHYRQSLALDPNNAIVLYEIAEALMLSGSDLEATEALRRAVGLAPNTAALLRLSRADLDLGKLDSATAYCQKALALDPASSQGHVLMGRILTEKGRPEAADEHWDEAKKFSEKPGEVEIEKALSLAASGLFEEAVRGLQDFTEAHPEESAGYHTLAFAKRVADSDRPWVLRMEGLLNARSLPSNDQIQLLFALGKAYDNLGDYERAIGYFDRANALKLELAGGAASFDRNAFRSLIDDRIKLFNREFYANWSGSGLASSLPILVVGMMRSGTTLAEQILSCHPEIGGAGEQPFWSNREQSVVDYQKLTVNPSRIRSVGREYVELLSSIAPGFPHVIDKNPANLLVLGSFWLAFPNSRVIHTRRNPIDTALSIWMTPMSTNAGFIGDRANIVFAYKECLRLMDHWREVLPDDRFLDIRYEELISDPESQIKRMVEFCGVEWDEACLHPELNKRRIRTPSFWQVRQPVYTSSAERWKLYEPWLGAFAELD